MSVSEYKLEMHLHTKGNSPCGHTPPSEIIKVYKEAGYDGVVCTNHFNRYLYENYLEGKNAAEKTEHFLRAFKELKSNTEGLDVYFGAEIAIGDDDYHSPTNMTCAEILTYGITPEEFAAYAETIVKTDYEGLRETADKFGWLLFQAHPYRPRTKRLSDKYLDGIEIFNANPRHCNYNFVAALKAASRGCPVVAGSDFHKPKDIGSAMLFPRKPANEKDLAEMLKKREYKILKEKPSWDKDSD